MYPIVYVVTASHKRGSNFQGNFRRSKFNITQAIVFFCDYDKQNLVAAAYGAWPFRTGSGSPRVAIIPFPTSHFTTTKWTIDAVIFRNAIPCVELQDKKKHDTLPGPFGEERPFLHAIEESGVPIMDREDTNFRSICVTSVGQVAEGR